MRKNDNDRHIEEDHEHDDGFKYQPCIVHINGEKYFMQENFAGLTQAILLLVDAINDKEIRNG